MATGIRQTAFVALAIGIGGAVMLLLPPYPAAIALWSMAAAGR